MFVKWTQNWKDTEGHRQSKHWYPKPCKRKTADLLNLPRWELSNIIGLTTGFSKALK